MNHIAEQTVQYAAQEFLLRRYKRQAGGSVYSQIEARTKKTLNGGGKRADGLLAYRTFFMGIYVVSMEAKSYKTLRAIKPYRDNRLFLWNSVKAGLIFCILTGAFFFLFKLDDGFVQFLLPLDITLMGMILYALFTQNSFKHKRAKVIEQLSQYPGNHQWLATSEDSMIALSERKQKELVELCRASGIGLMLITPRKKAKVILTPKMRWNWRGDFLKHYSSESKVRELLAN